MEHREIPPDDCIRRIPKELLGPRIPGQDLPARPQHAKSVIARAIDQESQPLLALREGSLAMSFFALGLRPFDGLEQGGREAFQAGLENKVLTALFDKLNGEFFGKRPGYKYDGYVALFPA